METLQVIFIVLKLAGLVAWSWWFVFSPTFIAVGVLVAMFGWEVAKEAWREVERKAL